MWPSSAYQETLPPYFLGNDLVAIARVSKQLQRYGKKAYATCLTPSEAAYVWLPPLPNLVAERLAVRLAAKEATAKALGVGLRGLGLGSYPQLQSQALLWREVEVVRHEATAQPSLVLHGRAAELANTLGLQGVRVALSHQGGLALANVLFWR